MAAASRAVLVGVLAAACLSALAPSAIARLSPSTEPSSPCPQVFRYEPNPSAASGWSAVIRLLAPSKFSALHLSLLLAASEHLPEEPAPGSLTLRGGVSAARALVRAAHQGRRKAVEYDVQFSCAVTAAPTLLNLTVNGRVFCAAMQEPAFSPSTITLVADLETGLDWASAGDAEFGVLPDDSRLAEEYSLHLGPEAAAAAVPPCGPAAPPLQPLQPAQPAQPPLEQHVQHAVPPTGDIYAAQNVPHHHMFVLPSLNPSYHYQSDKGYNGQIPPRESYSATPVSAAPTPPPPPPGVYMPPAPEVYTVPPTTSTPKNPEMYKPPPNAEPTPPPRPPPPQTPASPYDAPPPPPTPSDRTPLLEEDCGRAWSSAANPLVTRGAAAVRGRWPWLVALFKKLGRRDQLGLNFECGASLVSRKHVVTAAHCVEVRGRRRRPVDASLLVVYLGKHDLLSYTEPGQQTAEVDSVRMHPDYASGRSETTPATPTSSSGSTSAYDNDIALLVLTERVEPTKHIRPVCLWDAALAGTNLDDVVGKVGAVPGWGKDDTGAISNEIRVANMPIVSQETCLRSNVFYHTFTNKNTFCAGFRNGTSVCNGDSGGGLFVKDPDGRWRIRGIVSVSMFSVNDQSCDAYNYAVFTDVAKYLPWLFENMYSTWDSR